MRNNLELTRIKFSNLRFNPNIISKKSGTFRYKFIRAVFTFWAAIFLEQSSTYSTVHILCGWFVYCRCAKRRGGSFRRRTRVSSAAAQVVIPLSARARLSDRHHRRLRQREAALREYRPMLRDRPEHCASASFPLARTPALSFVQSSRCHLSSVQSSPGPFRAICNIWFVVDLLCR